MDFTSSSLALEVDELAIGSTRVLLSPFRNGTVVGRAGRACTSGLLGRIFVSKLIGAGLGADFCVPAAGIAKDIFVADPETDAAGLEPFVFALASAGPFLPGALGALGCSAITSCMS